MDMQVNCFTTRLKYPFVTSKGRTEAIQHVQVTLSHENHSGFGVCRLDHELDFRSVDLIRQALLGCDPFSPVDTVRDLEASAGRSALTVACDIALFDLIGKIRGIPAAALFGGINHVHKTAVSIGIQNEETYAASIKEYSDWPIIKIKLGHGQRAWILNDVRRMYDGEIWVDANGAWDIDTALAQLPLLEAAGVTVLEQPLPRGQYNELTRLRGSSVKIAADEDVDGLASIKNLTGCVDIVNVKLSSCGGLSCAAATLAAARHAGLETIIGCRTESVAGVTAASTLINLADYADLDGHLDIVNDPFEGVVISRGTIQLNGLPGIGAKQNTLKNIGDNLWPA